MASGEENKNDHEMYFEWWLKELVKQKLVIDFEYEPKQFKIFDPLAFFYKHSYKTKPHITKDITIFEPIVYTPDYRVVFDARMLNKLFCLVDYDKSYIVDDPELETGNVYQNTIFFATTQKSIVNILEKGYYELWFDVKPPAQVLQKNTKINTRDFRFTQRVMLFEHNIFVNKVVPIGSKTCIYNKTFTPDRYLFTDGGTQPRKTPKWLLYRKPMEYYLSKGIQI